MRKDPAKKDIDRIARAVRDRRESLGLSQDLSVYGGPKRNLVGGLETRGVWPRMPATRARWARALQWAPDAFDKLLAGEEPTELSVVEARVPYAPSAGAPSAAEIEAARGVLEAAIAGHQPARRRPVAPPPGVNPRERYVEASAVINILERVLDDVREEFVTEIQDGRQ